MPSNMNEIGATGLNISTTGASGSIINEEFLPNLHGRSAIRTYKEMSDNDPIVGGIMFAVDMLVRQVDWSVDRKKSTAADARFVEECMDDMSHSWGDLISEIMSMIVYGFSFHEIVYKRRRGYRRTGSETPSSKYNDGKIGWRKIPIRAQDSLDRWEFDDRGGLQAFVQRPAPRYEDIRIPIEKGLLFRTSVYKNNPEGRSLLRSAYRPWYYKRRIEEIEGIGIERDLAGFPVFRLPSTFLKSNAPPEMQQVRAAYEAIGRDIRRDKQEFLMLPSDVDPNGGGPMFSFELLSSGGARSFDTSAIIERYNQNIAMTILADFILLGHEQVGSFALSSDKTALFSVALGTILDSIADTFNRYAIPRLFVVNGMGTEKLPEIVHGDIESGSLSEIGAFLSSLSAAGMTLFPDEDLENFVREQANFPPRSEESKKAMELANKAGENGTSNRAVSGSDSGGSPDDAAPEGGSPGSGSGSSFLDQLRSAAQNSDPGDLGQGD